MKSFTIRDIYYKINSELVYNHFLCIDVEEKKKLLDKTFKKYTASKINELSSKQLSDDEIEKSSMNDLLTVLKSLIPAYEHFDTLRHFVHYVLSLISDIQCFEILWCIEKDESLIENPIININEQNKINSLITHEKTDYIKTFNFAYNILCNQVLQESKSYQKNTQ